MFFGTMDRAQPPSLSPDGPGRPREAVRAISSATCSPDGCPPCNIGGFPLCNRPGGWFTTSEAKKKPTDTRAPLSGVAPPPGELVRPMRPISLGVNLYLWSREILVVFSPGKKTDST
jgi:hypothetical protein